MTPHFLYKNGCWWCYRGGFRACEAFTGISSSWIKNLPVGFYIPWEMRYATSEGGGGGITALVLKYGENGLAMKNFLQ